MTEVALEHSLKLHPKTLRKHQRDRDRARYAALTTTPTEPLTPADVEFAPAVELIPRSTRQNLGTVQTRQYLRGRTKEERTVLRYAVWSAMSRGLTAAQTATYYSLSVSAVETLLHEARLQDEVEFSAQTQLFLAKRFWIASQRRVAQLEHLFATTYDHQVKVRCLVAAHVIEKETLEIGQRLGLVQDVPLTDGNTVDTVRTWLKRYDSACSLVDASGLVADPGRPELVGGVTAGGGAMDGRGP